jgi:hypothetical protein
LCRIKELMWHEAVMKAFSKRPVLKTTNVGGRTLVFFDSVLQALGIDPATEPADRPITVTIPKVMEMTSLSKRTVDRMIRAGREAVAA